MPKPFFSIILPTYNRASFLGRAIESVLNQTYGDFELIIVDDGSTDNTKEVVRRYKDARIRYYWKENEERNIARNFGIEKAQGEYIGFLDSDDFYLENHLSVMFDRIEMQGSAWIFAFNNLRKIKALEGDYRMRLIWDSFLQMNGVVILAQLLKELSFLNSKSAIVGEDHHLWLKLAARYQLDVIAEDTSVVVEHETRSLRSIDLNKLIIGTEEIILDLKTDPYFVKFYGWRVKWYFSFLWLFVSLVANEKSEYKVSWKYIKKAFFNFPFIIIERRFIACVKNLVFRR